jgi:hypothetical protein
MKKDGGFAFPMDNSKSVSEAGMTLRQWYAGQALAGLCSAFPATVASTLASWAFEQADAMIDAVEAGK